MRREVAAKRRQTPTAEIGVDASPASTKQVSMQQKKKKKKKKQMQRKVETGLWQQKTGPRQQSQ